MSATNILNISICYQFIARAIKQLALLLRSKAMQRRLPTMAEVERKAHMNQEHWDAVQVL